MRKWFSRKWLLVLLWFGLLTYCCVRDGDMISSGFCKILAVTGAIVTASFILGNIALQIEQIKLTHGSTSIELKTRRKEKKDGKKRNTTR